MTPDDPNGIALGLVAFLLIVALYVWTSVALSAVFRKSGEQGWKGWVPILNQIVLLQLGRLSPLLFLLVLIPFAGPVIVWALLVVACYRINLAFGHGAGMTVLAALVLPVWASILGFGPARWLGSDVSARGVAVGGPRRTAATSDDEDAYVPRAAPPAYSPSAPFPAAPASGWTPPPVPPAPALSSAPPIEPAPVVADAEPPASVPLAAPVAGRSTLESAVQPGRWGAFDLGAVTEVTDDVTGSFSAAPAPVSAVPVGADVPLVTHVPPAPAPPTAPEPWAPAASRTTEPDVFPETSGEVSAAASGPVRASASRGSVAEPQWEATPRSARSTVSAQHTKAEIPEDPIDETIITRRRRTAWSLVPPAGAAVPITADVVLLGRKPAPDPAYPTAQLISIDDGTVSKTHARLSLRDDHWYVTDLGSTNGVLFATLMGTEIEATPGEEVEAGEQFFLGDAPVRLQRSDG